MLKLFLTQDTSWIYPPVKQIPVLLTAHGYHGHLGLHVAPPVEWASADDRETVRDRVMVADRVRAAPIRLRNVTQERHAKVGM